MARDGAPACPRVRLWPRLLISAVMLGSVACSTGAHSGERGSTAARGPAVAVRLVAASDTSAGKMAASAAVIEGRLRDAKVVPIEAVTVHGDEIVFSVHSSQADFTRNLMAEGRLEFRPVLAIYARGQPTSSLGAPSSTLPSAISPDEEAHDVLANQIDPTSGRVISTMELGPVVLTGSAIQSTSVDLSQDGVWEVRPVLRAGPDGIDRLNQIAAICFAATRGVCPSVAAPHGQLAILLDGAVLTAPSIDASSFQRDEITISGSFTQGQANDIGAVLEAGALPVTFTVTVGS
jgi:preprotein translocase subunit SecD